ncbi:hypothetical protein [Pseudoalteromonas piratica]|uniref:Uncharacterized protein n=1 Tax=Pseudoalteromonas piratica TaxID=1348114 RepID=A0A0A7ECF4_9GAMM|nr:hypothetical protein [Pseudoalteromonas piratica]AIY64269.1 hypothetical protein OM33_03195 [Pseudoalteromonas piratica]
MKILGLLYLLVFFLVLFFGLIGNSSHFVPSNETVNVSKTSAYFFYVLFLLTSVLVIVKGRIKIAETQKWVANDKKFYSFIVFVLPLFTILLSLMFYDALSKGLPSIQSNYISDRHKYNVNAKLVESDRRGRNYYVTFKILHEPNIEHEFNVSSELFFETNLLATYTFQYIKTPFGTQYFLANPEEQWHFSEV